MWDHSDIPVINQFHPSGFSPVTYHAENGLEHLRIDIFAERNWISSPGLNVAMRVGLAHAGDGQAVGNVLDHRHMREERVGLEHHRDVPGRRR